MPYCSEVVALLLDYLEERLPTATRADLERHLAACPRCLAHLNTYRSTVSLLESLEDDDLSEELRVTLRAFLDRRAAN